MGRLTWKQCASYRIQSALTKSFWLINYSFRGPNSSLDLIFVSRNCKLKCSTIQFINENLLYSNFESYGRENKED